MRADFFIDQRKITGRNGSKKSWCMTNWGVSFTLKVGIALGSGQYRER